MTPIDLFIESWTGKETMVPIQQFILDEAQHQLDIIFPESYRYLLTTYGLIHSPNVLTKTCDLSVNINMVQDFLSLEDVDSLTKLYQMSGMASGYVLFASDSQGNMFCFKLSDCENGKQDAPVWFFDRGLNITNKVADSFVRWLNQFNTL